MTDVRWLSAREQEVWRSYLAATGAFSEHLDRQLQRDSGMPLAYYEILVALSEAPGRSMRMSRLADVCRSSRSRLSHAVARLEDQGWVCRRACESDKRGSFAELTDRGFAALRSAAPGHVSAVRKHLFDVLTPDQVAALGEISAAIQNGLSAVCEQARAELKDF
jgi:DNA-binding MarR family transcriptional regulator